jgi:hypothetical protein
VKPAAGLADRYREVRLAARDWRSAGLVDDATVAEIDRRFPDDRVRAGLVLRLLLFVFAFIAGIAAIGLFTFIDRHWSIVLMMGLVFGALTELQTSFLRRCGGGTEEATSLFAVALTSGGLIWALNQSRDMGSVARVEVGALVVLALAAAAAWRWGMPAYGAVACLALFVFEAQLPAPRALWVILAAALAAGCEAARRSAALAPSHRAAAEWALVSAIALAYLAVNVWGLDEHVIEELAAGGRYGPPGFSRTLAIVLTAALPPLTIAVGARRRDRLWLWTGLVMVIASAVTLRHYVHLAPLWVLLASIGAAIVAIALLLQRWLEAGAGHERRGFTAQPLFEGRFERSAEVIAALATIAPAARAMPAEAPGEMKPGGGSFGGGGASETF